MPGSAPLPPETAADLPSDVAASPAVATMVSAPPVPGRVMRIGELAERSGRTERTLRFYEEIGLLTPVARTKGGFRLYDDNALVRIEWIARLQDLGFSLPEVKEFLHSLHNQPTAPAMMTELRSFYARKLEETRATVKRLRALELELSRSLAYLDPCQACAPSTATHACHACADEEHQGVEAPGLVAAIVPSPEHPEAR